MQFPQTGLRRLQGPFARLDAPVRRRTTVRDTVPLPIIEPTEPVEVVAQGEGTLSQQADRFSRPALVQADLQSRRANLRRVWRPWPRPVRLFDRTLLAVELACALVVLWLVGQYIYTVYIDTTPHRLAGRVASTRSAAAVPTVMVPPTATRIVEVVPPLVGAPVFGAQPGSIPAANTATSTATPTATPTVDPQLLLPVRLRIPVMFLDSPVHEVKVNMGVWEVSPLDIGHHIGTGNPGQVGNVVLAAHRDINSALFRDLDRLQPGDEVFVSNALHEYRYIVTDSFVVSPDHTEVMAPTDDKRVTLITCTPIGLDTQRLIVTAILDDASSPR